MKNLQPGHAYYLDEYSGFDPNKTLDTGELLYFMHRIGPGYPGNEGTPHNGTNCQEVLRALIDRVKYLNSQEECDENHVILDNLRSAIYEFEQRAAKRHNVKFTIPIGVPIEELPTCRTCGHLVCKHQEQKP